MKETKTMIRTFFLNKGRLVGHSALLIIAFLSGSQSAIAMGKKATYQKEYKEIELTPLKKTEALEKALAGLTLSQATEAPEHEEKEKENRKGGPKFTYRIISERAPNEPGIWRTYGVELDNFPLGSAVFVHQEDGLDPATIRLQGYYIYDKSCEQFHLINFIDLAVQKHHEAVKDAMKKITRVILKDPHTGKITDTWNVK